MSTWVPKLGRRKAPLYIKIADALAEDVAAGRLEAGTRIPAHRALAADLGVDFTTVSRAYAEARRRGLVVGQPGRGTFVRDHGADNPERIIDLSLNAPPDPEAGYVEREFASALGTLSSHADLGRFLHYKDSQGALDHREAAALWIEEHGIAASPDCIVICNGAQHAIAVVLASLGAAGNTVLTEGLTFPAMKPLAQYLGARLVGVPMDDDGIRPDAFARACRDCRPIALCTVPTLHNPTAIVMSEVRRREIAEVARDHGVAIVEDDAYGGIPSDAPAPLSTHAPEVSYYVASLSKSTTPGLRVAYVLAPDERKAVQATNATRAFLWMVAPLLVEIAARWIRDGTAGRILRARREEAAMRQRIAAAALGSWLTHPHRYACHSWIALPERWSTTDFVAAARYRGVAVSPSDAFAVSPDFAVPAVRVSLGSVSSRADLSRGVNTLAAMLDGEAATGTVLL